MEKLDSYYAVIMAGGGGTRLWPLSRRKTPKQMVKIIGDETLFQISVNRLRGLFHSEKIFVVTIADQVKMLQSQAPDIPNENFLIEPFPKGTASVVGYAATYLQKKDSDAVLAILTADHFIQNVEEFHQLLIAGYLAAKENFLVTLGIQPTHAATGYGYIHKGEPVKSFNGKWGFIVNKFLEKPDEEKAKLIFSSGGYDWNSGMFIWNVDAILREFDRQMPGLKKNLDLLKDSLEHGNFEEKLPEIWADIIPQTIDYGIMEHAENVIVLPVAELGWFDVGSWDSLFDVIEQDDHGNINLARKFLGLDTKNSLVYSNVEDRYIVTVGLENIILVESGNAILVCDRKKSQDIKNVVKFLTDKKFDDYF